MNIKFENVVFSRVAGGAVAVNAIKAGEYKNWLKKQSAHVSKWLKAASFEAKAGKYCAVRDAGGKITKVVAILSDKTSIWDLSALQGELPRGTYRLECGCENEEVEKLALGWILGAYKFSRYKKNDKEFSKLCVGSEIYLDKVKRCAEAIGLVRDLINTPASDMGPQELADAVRETGKKFGAKITQIIGGDLLKKNYPAIHAVGRASAKPPRLVDLRWGNPKHPLIVLVGKGVCFDSGGLDIKPSGAMNLMKKDMAGAACALGVAQMVMGAKLQVSLRLLIPAVENAISGDAYRPSDVIRMRDGATVEVGDTDAEGRLVLADCLVEASGEKPAMIIDFATLTGAARSALGTGISALFSNDDDLAEDLLAAGRDEEDSLWRMPLFEAYDSMLESKVADVNSCPATPYAGAITAALFLRRFVGKDVPWAHLDFMGWNLSSKPGRPEGGEAMSVRAVYKMIERRTKK